MAELSRILIVDDDPDIRKVLTFLLEEKYSTDEAVDGASAVEFIRTHPDTDLVILDVLMPGMSGFETCGEIRKLSNVPILFLTARSAEKDRLSAYSGGGDDFLSKPYSNQELLAKVSSLLRRYREYRGKPESVCALEDLEVDFQTRTVKRLGTDALLTETEFALLEYMLRHRGRTVTTAELYEAVWNEKFLRGSGNTIMVHILNLRRKIEEKPSSPKIVRTVWGKGYQID